MKSKLQIQNFRVALFTLLITMLSLTGYSQGCPVDQSTADFYTKASGEFSNPSIWEYQDSCGNWVEATQPPSAGNSCRARLGTAATCSSTSPNMVIKSLVLETGSTLLIEGELTVSDGSGGTGGTGGTGGNGSGIQISGSIVITHTGRLLDSSDAPINILSGGILTHQGHLLKPKDEILNIHSGGTIISTGEIQLSGDMTIDGHFSGNGGALYLTADFTQTITANSDNNNLGDVIIDKGLLSSEVRIHNNALLTTLDFPLLSMVKGTVKFFNQTKGFGFIKAESTAESIIVAGTADLFVRGDMTIQGQFDGPDCKLTLDGTNPQVITYDPAVPSLVSNFGDVSFSNTSAAGLLLTGPPTALFLSKKGYDYYQMQSDMSCTFLESFTIGSSATMEVIGATDISVGGDWINNGIFTPGTGTVSFTSSGTSSLGGTTSPQIFYNLEINKDSDLDRVDIDCDDLDVANDLTVTKGRSRKGLNAVNVRIVNRMSVSPSAIFDGNLLDVSVGGDMTVHGQYDGALGKLTFDGTSAQALEHSPDPASPPSNFGELELDNPSTVQLGGTEDIITAKTHTKTGHVTLLKRTAATQSFRVDAGSEVTIGSLVEVAVSGEMTVHGQYDGALGKLTFDGSSVQVLDHSPDPASLPSNFGEVVYDNESLEGVTVQGNDVPFISEKKEFKGHVTFLKRTAAKQSFIVDEGGIVTTGSLVEVVVYGDMTVHGQYDGVLGKLTFDGTSAQVLDHSPLPGSPASNFGEVVIRGNAFEGVTVSGVGTDNFTCEKLEIKRRLTLNTDAVVHHHVAMDSTGDFVISFSTNLSVGGDWTNNGGTFDPGTSTVIFNGSGNSKIGGTSSTQYFNDLTIDKSVGPSCLFECVICHARTITIQSGNLDAGTITDIFVSGDWINNGGTFIPGTSKVSFEGGTGDSHIGGTVSTQNFHKIRLRESPTLASTGQTKRTVCSGSTTSLHAQDIEISEMALFDSGTASEVEVSGDWTNNGGTFLPGTGTVVFSGTPVQNIGGTTSTTFNDFKTRCSGCNDPWRGDISAAVTINGVLDFSGDGNIELNTYDLTLGSASSIIGASPTRYIVTNGKGSVKRQLLTIVGGPDTQMVYPIGTETSYNPVTYQLFSVTGQPVVLGARVANGVSTGYDSNENPIGTAIVDRAVLKTFFATGDIPPGDHITIHPQWNVADEGLDFDRAVCDLGHYTEGQWIRSTPTAAVEGDNPGAYTGTYNVTVTALSPFAVFSQNSTSCSSVGEWTGVVSTAWENPNNWCNGILPTATTNVVIPSGTPYQPAITTGAVVGIAIAAVIAALTINSGATLTVSDNLELHVSGDMTVYGQYNGFDGKLVFDGASAQVFDHSPDPASPPSNFGEVVFSNTAGGITIMGNTIPIVAREASTPSISEIVVTKRMDMTGPVLINTGAKFTITATGELSVGGDMTVHGQYDGALGKLTFDGASAQVFDHSPDPASPPSNFGEVVFSNTAGGITIMGNTIPIVAREASTPSISEIVVTKRMDMTGPVLINPGAQFTVTATGELSVGGDMTVHGQYNGVDGKLTFDGSSAQVLDHSPDPASPPSNFGELELDNPSTVQLGGTEDIITAKTHTKTGHVTLLKRTAATQSFRVDAGSEVTIGSLVEVAVSGEMTVHGQYDGALGKLTFDGSSAQVLDHSPDLGSPPSNFGEVVYDNQSLEGVTVQGNDVPFISEKKEFKGHVTLLKRTAARQDVVIDSSGNIFFGNSIEFSVGRDWTNNGGVFDPGTSTVSFEGGTGDSHIGGTASSQDFFKLMIRESPTLASTGQNKGTICTGTVSTVRAHNIEISSAAAFDSGTASLIELSGDWTNNGAFIANSSEVKFKCLVIPCTRSVVDGLSSTNFHKLTVDNPEGLEIRESPSFPRLTTVSGELKFTNGKIFLVGVGDLVMNEDAIITGASSEKYLVSSCTHVFQANNPSLIYPIGTTLGYSPVSVDLEAITTPGLLKVKATQLDTSQLSTIGISEISHVSTLFTVEDDETLAFGSCAMTFSWYGSLSSGDVALYHVKMRNPGSTTWVSANVIARTANSITIDGLTSFGEFVIGELGVSNVVNLKLFIEGYYLGGGLMATVENNQDFPDYLLPINTNVENITVELHDAITTELVATTTAMLQTNGTATCSFPTAPSGSFYIAVKTRNAVQTWSTLPQTVGVMPLFYDFSAAATQAYADNQVSLGGGVFGLFSGDIDSNGAQDGEISPADYSEWEANANAFSFGSYAADLNGDGEVGPSDYSIWEANANTFVFAYYPPAP